jgi:hypothetical protein
VTLDISVQVDSAANQAASVVDDLVATMRRLEPAAKPGANEPWLPKAHQATPPAGLRGAACAIELPGDDRAHFFATTFGGLQHLLLLRGSAAALRTRAAAIDALLASYRLLEDCDHEVAAQRPLTHHTGGSLTGSSYHNVHFGLRLVGEAGWQPAMRSGGAAFRVVWSSPQGGRLWLTGHRVPVGMARWDDDSADRWFLQMLAHNELVPTTPLVAAGWSPDAALAGTRRDVVATRAPTVTDTLPGPARQRLFRLVRRSDLLLVLDGLPATDDEAAAVQRMFAALTRD